MTTLYYVCIVLMSPIITHARTHAPTHTYMNTRTDSQTTYMLRPYMCAHYYTRRRIIVIYKTVTLLCKIFAYYIH